MTELPRKSKPIQPRCVACGHDLYGLWADGRGYTCSDCHWNTPIGKAGYRGLFPQSWTTQRAFITREFEGATPEEAAARADRQEAAAQAAGWKPATCPREGPTYNSYSDGLLGWARAVDGREWLTYQADLDDGYGARTTHVVRIRYDNAGRPQPSAPPAAVSSAGISAPVPRGSESLRSRLSEDTWAQAVLVLAVFIGLPSLFVSIYEHSTTVLLITIGACGLLYILFIEPLRKK